MKQYKIVFISIVILIGLISIINDASFAHAAIYSSLTIGSRGQQVQELQQTLTTLGLYNGPVTGYFGPLTRAAVIKFQKAHNIFPQVGYFGNLTRGKLNKVFGQSAINQPPPKPVIQTQPSGIPPQTTPPPSPQTPVTNLDSTPANKNYRLGIIYIYANSNRETYDSEWRNKFRIPLDKAIFALNSSFPSFKGKINFSYNVIGDAGVDTFDWNPARVGLAGTIDYKEITNPDTSQAKLVLPQSNVSSWTMRLPGSIFGITSFEFQSTIQRMVRNGVTTEIQ